MLMYFYPMKCYIKQNIVSRMKVVSLGTYYGERMNTIRYRAIQILYVEAK